MATRRHLPILQSSPAPAPAPVAAEGGADEPPPWHWIPLGSVVSVVAFALLAQGAATLSTRILARVYRPNLSVADIAAGRRPPARKPMRPGVSRPCASGCRFRPNGSMPARW